MHEIAQRAAEAAQIPSFDDVLARGRRHRNRRNGLVAGAAALAVVAIVGGAQLVGTDDGENQPAPDPTPTITDPADFIDAPGATVAQAAVAEDGVAVLWRHVNKERHVLAVSTDGFVTRTTSKLPIPGEVIAAGDGFILRDEAHSRIWVVDTAGERRLVEVSGTIAPVAEGEVPVSGPDGLLAVDPSTAIAHPVPTPEDFHSVTAYGGRLSVVSTYVRATGEREATYHWSDDGGANWHTAATFDPRGLGQIVPTPAGSDHVIAVIADGATIAPLEAVFTMPAGGESFTRTDRESDPVAITSAWTAAGEVRFLAGLIGDGTGPLGEPGIYRWDDGLLQRVESSAPEVTDDEDAELVDVVESDGGPTVLLAIGDRLYRSTDGGATWDELRAR